MLSLLPLLHYTRSSRQSFHLQLKCHLKTARQLEVHLQGLALPCANELAMLNVRETVGSKDCSNMKDVVGGRSAKSSFNGPQLARTVMTYLEACREASEGVKVLSSGRGVLLSVVIGQGLQIAADQVVEVLFGLVVAAD